MTGYYSSALSLLRAAIPHARGMRRPRARARMRACVRDGVLSALVLPSTSRSEMNALSNPTAAEHRCLAAHLAHSRTTPCHPPLPCRSTSLGSCKILAAAPPMHPRAEHSADERWARRIEGLAWKRAAPFRSSLLAPPAKRLSNPTSIGLTLRYPRSHVCVRSCSPRLVL